MIISDRVIRDSPDFNWRNQSRTTGCGGATRPASRQQWAPFRNRRRGRRVWHGLAAITRRLTFLFDSCRCVAQTGGRPIRSPLSARWDGSINGSDGVQSCRLRSNRRFLLIEGLVLHKQSCSVFDRLCLFVLCDPIGTVAFGTAKYYDVG